MLYEDTEVDVYNEVIPKISDLLNEFLQKYLNNAENFIELTYGSENIHRKMVLSLYSYENHLNYL